MRKLNQITLHCDVEGCTSIGTFRSPGPFGPKAMAGWVRLELWLTSDEAKESVVKAVDICPVHTASEDSWLAFKRYVMRLFQYQREAEQKEEEAQRPAPTPIPTTGRPDPLGP